jgi:hypothetical protein
LKEGWTGRLDMGLRIRYGQSLDEFYRKYSLKVSLNPTLFTRVENMNLTLSIDQIGPNF